MNLAAPAPTVGPAFAKRAEYVEPAKADMVQQSEPVDVDPPEAVDPAVLYTPAIVSKPKSLRSNELSVQALRGEMGADFEGYAAILHGAPEKNCLQQSLPCIFDEGNYAAYGEAKKYCLLKGGECFVYGYHTDLKPLYVVPLSDLYPLLEDPNKPDKFSITISPMPGTNRPHREMVTILLKNKSDNRQAFQFTFDTGHDPTLAKRFLRVVQTSGSVSANLISLDDKDSVEAKI